uniref:Uncharacterized protein n=1 Tax=Anguilla anguilla TaxID=7936 RepID=A0A0E9S8R9_ANGAN
MCSGASSNGAICDKVKTK